METGIGAESPKSAGLTVVLKLESALESAGEFVKNRVLGLIPDFMKQ